MNGTRAWRMALAALLVISAEVFAVASRAERAQEHVEQGVISGASEAGHCDGDRGKEAATPRTEAAETLLGVKTESATTAAGVVLVSFVAAGLVLSARRHWWLWGRRGLRPRSDPPRCSGGVPPSRPGRSWAAGRSHGAGLGPCPRSGVGRADRSLATGARGAMPDSPRPQNGRHRRPRAYTTVLTTMVRLAEHKGLLQPLWTRRS